MSCRVSIQRERRVTGAKAMSSSFGGSGPGSTRVRTNWSRGGPAVWPGSTGFQTVAGASPSSSAICSWTRASLEHRGHGRPPARRRHRAFGVGQLHLRELLGFRERPGRHLRSDGGRRVERGRRARCRLAEGGLRLGAAARRREASHAQGRADEELSARIHGAWIIAAAGKAFKDMGAPPDVQDDF